MKINLSKLKQTSFARPAGYLEDVLSHGKIAGDYLVIEPEKYSLLCHKYSSSTNLGQAGTCCKSAQKPKSEIPFPSIPTQLKNVSRAGFSAIGAIIRGQPVRRADEDIEKIKGICHNCEFFDLDKARCRKCGCKLGLPMVGKWHWATEKCPVNKW